jgi:hypothetical protein
MNQRKRDMVWIRITGLTLAVAACLATAGCEGGTDNGPQPNPPAVDVNGEWNVAEDGAFLGVMTFVVDSSNGDLGGQLDTKDGSQARLYGTMAGLAATFTMVFPTEDYEVKLLFAETGNTAAGTAVDRSGFSRGLALTRRTGF